MGLIINGDFQKTKIRKTSADNVAGGEYIKEAFAYFHDFHDGPFKIQDWYISHYFRKTPYNLATEDDGVLSLHWTEIGPNSKTMYSYLGANFANLKPNVAYNIFWPCKSGSELSSTNILYSTVNIGYDLNPAFSPTPDSGPVNFTSYLQSWAHEQKPDTSNPTVSTSSVSSNKNAWQTLVVFNDNPMIVKQKIYNYDNKSTFYTRMNESPVLGDEIDTLNANSATSYFYNGAPVSAPSFFDRGIHGPYPDIQINGSSENILEIYIYAHFSVKDYGGTIYLRNAGDFNPYAPSPPNLSSTPPPEKPLDKKTWHFGVFQKPVSILLDGVGNLISKTDESLNTHFGPILNEGVTLTFNRTLSRREQTHGTTTMTWIFKKYVGLSGDLFGWTDINPGSEISLGSGESASSDIINVTFQELGIYAIVNRMETTLPVPSWAGAPASYYTELIQDPYWGQMSPNIEMDLRKVTISAGLPLIEEASVWPNLFTLVTSEDTDPIEIGPPLKSAQPFTIKVSAAIDGTGIWKIINPNTHQTLFYPGDGDALTIEEWKVRMNERFIIKCIIKNTETGIVVTKYGWGPNIINLNAGSYTVQYIAEPNEWYNQQLLTSQQQSQQQQS